MNASHNTQQASVLCAATIAKVPFRERVAAARAAGFSAISLFPEQYLDAREGEKLSASEMRSIMIDEGIRLATVDPLLDWYGEEASRSEQLLYDMAHELGAPALNAAPAFAPDLALAQLAEHFARLCQRADAQGLRVDLEVLPWSRVGNYSQAFELLQLAGADNSGITLDCLHFYRCGDSVETLRQLSTEQLQRISNIQLCDIAARPQALGLRDRIAAGRVMLQTGRNGMRVLGLGGLLAANRQAYVGRDDANSLMQEATCNRLLPGEGDIPLRDLLEFLWQAGVQPELGIEVFSLRLNRLPATEAAELCMNSWQQLRDTIEAPLQ